MLPQFYNKISVLNSKLHGQLSFKPIDNYAFTAKTNIIHLQANEFVSALAFFPIVFVGKDTKVSPGILTGVESGRNLFVDENGKWTGTYMPAYIRRYPFIMANDDKGQGAVCFDETHSGFNQDNIGEALFNADGKPADYLNRAISFLEHFDRSNGATCFLVQQLVKHDLLEPIKAEFDSVDKSKGKVAIEGFQAVSRDKLAKLTAEQLAQLRDQGVLELIYYHLASLKQFDNLLARFNR